MPCVCAAELSKKYVVCHDVNVLKGLRVLGYVVLIVKVLVPVVLIITGMYAFFKAMVASDEREIKDAVTLLISKVITGIIVFFIPTIISAVLSLIKNVNTSTSTYAVCVKCVVSVKDCNMYIDAYKNSTGNW